MALLQSVPFAQMKLTDRFWTERLETVLTTTIVTRHPGPCCTMNVARLIPSVSGYLYSSSSDTSAVHMYASNEADIMLGRRQVRIVQTSEIPRSGGVELEFYCQDQIEFDLKLRIPGWREKAEWALGQGHFEPANASADGYLSIKRVRQSGERVRLNLQTESQNNYAHPTVAADRGKASLSYGSFVYCIEAADNPGLDLSQTSLPDRTDIEVQRADLFDDIQVLQFEGIYSDSETWPDNLLYRCEPMRRHSVPVVAIPYFLWCNRGANQMRVWINEQGLN